MLQSKNDLSSLCRIGFLKMFACFAPHLGEELWATVFDQKDSIAYEPWPDI